MGLFFFVRCPPSVSSPGEEKPLKNDFGAKQPYARSEVLPIKGFLRNPPQWVPGFGGSRTTHHVKSWVENFSLARPGQGRFASALPIWTLDLGTTKRGESIKISHGGLLICVVRYRFFVCMASSPGRNRPGGRTGIWNAIAFEIPLSAPPSKGRKKSVGPH